MRRVNRMMRVLWRHTSVARSTVMQRWRRCQQRVEKVNHKFGGEMPRTTPVDSYVMHRLRFIAGNKRYAPSIQLRAINRISAIEARKAAGLHWAYTVKISDDDRDGEYLLRPTSE